MKRPFIPVLFVFVLVSLACGGLSAAPAAAPTVMSLPATPNLAPTVAITPAITLPATGEALPASTPFTGTWTGPDPDDGSSMTLTLVQTGSTLEGAYSDTYSATIAPPGYAGTVSGAVLSPTTAQVTMQLGRHDGSNLALQANHALSGPNTLTETVTSAAASPWVLTRQ